MLKDTNNLKSYIQTLIRTELLELNTFMPAKVVNYYPATQTVDLKLTLKRTLVKPPRVVERPRLYNVPVMFPKSGSQYIHLPLEKGDNVGVIFCQRSLDDWKLDGDVTKVNSIRMHDINDAVCIAGLDIERDCKTLASNTKLSISSTSGMWIGNPQGTPASAAGVSEAELFQALGEMCSLLSNLTTTTASTGSSVSGGAVTTTGAGSIDKALSAQLTELSALFKSIAGN